MTTTEDPQTRPEAPKTPLKRSRLRRAAALFAVSCFALIASSPLLIQQVGGAFEHQPEDMKTKLSAQGQSLLTQIFKDVNPNTLFDYHTHVVGLGTDNSGIEVNGKLKSWWHPLEHMKFLVYYSAAGIEDDAHPDRDYLRRLNALIENIPPHGRHLALGFDHNYTEAGQLNADESEFYVPNQWVFDAAEARPDLIVPAISVHPYRPDALAQLDTWGQKGARFIKWLPNAMNIDPASAKCDAYYQKMKQYDMVLLCHTGEEQAVESEDAQELGNPLRLRRALDCGVKVILAHCATLGESLDLDNLKEDGKGPLVSNFELFLRLMSEKKYEGLVFGELSATTQFNRMQHLAALLEHTELHGRLVNGSDYPLPAINILIRTGKLAREGFITEAEREALNEIYDFNPLLFDFALKRCLKHPKTGLSFPVRVFHRHPQLGPKARKAQ